MALQRKPTAIGSAVSVLLSLALLLALTAVLTATLTACNDGSNSAQQSLNNKQSDQSQNQGQSPAQSPAQSNANRADTTPSGQDIVIPLAEVSDQARFYPTEVNGTALEVLAVKAPDGSIRTAFNTCQVCYDSGRGYYVQEGSVLVCQNCGNRFAMDDVEVISGGCNPVPIFDEDKIVTESEIRIPASFLAESEKIFKNWKSAV